MLRTTGKLTWIESSGGPLLLLDHALLAAWAGIAAPAAGGTVRGTMRVGAVDVPVTDYDRARAVEDYLGVIEVGSGEGLVLDASPLATTWWSSERGRRGGMLVRYIYAEDEPLLLRLLAQVPNSLWQPAGIVFTTARPPLFLFDPIYAGKQAPLYLTVDLRRGSYAVDTAFYQPDDTLSLLLHRFRPL